MNTLLRFRSAYGRLLTLCGVIAGVITFAMMALVTVNVVSRYAFNRPIAGAFELTEGALPIIIFLSLALTQYHGGHIRVTLLTDRLGPAIGRAAMVIAMLAGAVLFAWAAWAGWLAAAKSLTIGEIERGSIRYPIWPIKYAVCFGMFLLSLQYLIDAACAAMGIDTHQNAHDPEMEVLE